MAGANERKPFLLRVEPATMAALKAWAADDLRSLNGQIEYLLRSALRDAGRLPSKTGRHGAEADADAEPDPVAPPTPPGEPAARSALIREPAASGKVGR